MRYKEVFNWLKEFADTEIDVLHIIGGGSLNGYLNQMTADACGVKVIAGPQEGTAIGNAMIQAQAVGLYKSRWEMRKAVAEAIGTKVYTPNK